MHQGRRGREEEEPGGEQHREREGRGSERCIAAVLSEGNKLFRGKPEVEDWPSSKADEKASQEPGELCLPACHKNQHQAAKKGSQEWEDDRGEERALSFEASE